MKRTILFALATAGVLCAQPESRHVSVSAGIGGAFMQIKEGANVQGAPYSATLVNESTQTLADGNRIVQRETGSTARDSMGRTRQDMPLPSIGNLSAANAPHMVFIQDPVAQTGYTLNLTDKTAHKMPALPPLAGRSGRRAEPVTIQHFEAGGIATQSFAISAGGGAGPGPMIFKTQIGPEQAEVKSEDLGTQTMQGVSVQGVRTTRTIPAGQIGNDKPIDVVTEVWTSPELHTIVYSKRSDPRTGEQVFQLTNIQRSEPDSSLFTVPADFKVVEGPEGKGNVIFYRPNE